MTQTTFAVDEATLEAIKELKSAFGVKTNAQVIRKALALARVAAKKADKDTHTVRIASESDPQDHATVMLTG